MRIRNCQYLLPVALLASSSCHSGEKAPKPTVGGPPIAVVVTAVEQRDVPIFTELTARTDANESVEIRARVRSFLEAQHYREGTPVSKGQLLFTLDKREFEAQRMQASAQLSKANADLAQARDRTSVQTAEADLEIASAQLNKTDQDVARLKPLAEQQAVPQQDYDNALAAQRSARGALAGKKAGVSTAKVNQTAEIQQALAGVEAAKASIRQADLNLEFCNITSPIDGIAGARLIAPGNLVGQGEASLLTTVSNLNPMRVLMSISEREYLQMTRLRAEGKWQKTGEIELVLADGSTFPYKGRFVIADRAVDLKTGTLALIAEFPNPNAVLRPGQFARARLVATVAAQALLVPQKAVTDLQSSRVVYVVGADNKVLLRTVTLGERTGQNFIITDGLKAGERVIVEGVQKVRPGATVTATDRSLTSEPKEF